MIAAHYKHTKIIARLLEYGADRDIKDYDGHNALTRVDGDEMRYLIMNTKSFAEIAAEAEKARKEAEKAALGVYCAYNFFFLFFLSQFCIHLLPFLYFLLPSHLQSNCPIFSSRFGIMKIHMSNQVSFVTERARTMRAFMRFFL